MVATTVPIRLITALLLSLTPLIDEPLTWSNIVGCVIVFISVTFYLYMQYYYKRQELRKQDELEGEKKLLDVVSEEGETRKVSGSKGGVYNGKM